MGCCKSKNQVEDDQFDELQPINKDSKLDQYIERQKEFELKLRARYESRPQYEFVVKHDPQTRRVIKPFLSSTFRDFGEERDFLLKKCFPLISARCNERGLNFIPIDLRWGVTVDQCNSGQVIKLFITILSVIL